MARKTISPEDKLRSLIEDSGRSIKDIARSTGLPYCRLWRWQRNGQAILSLNDGAELWHDVTGNPVHFDV